MLIFCSYDQGNLFLKRISLGACLRFQRVSSRPSLWRARQQQEQEWCWNSRNDAGAAAWSSRLIHNQEAEREWGGLGPTLCITPFPTRLNLLICPKSVPPTKTKHSNIFALGGAFLFKMPLIKSRTMI